MPSAELTVALLSHHGLLRPQPSAAWTGVIPLPLTVAAFWQHVGPHNITLPAYGNEVFIPSLAGLWELQAGYRWNALTGDPVNDWNADWLVVAVSGGDPLIYSEADDAVLSARHGTGAWHGFRLFPDLPTMGSALAALGVIVRDAGFGLTDDDELVRPRFVQEAREDLAECGLAEATSTSVLEWAGWLLPGDGN